MAMHGASPADRRAMTLGICDTNAPAEKTESEDVRPRREACAAKKCREEEAPDERGCGTPQATQQLSEAYVEDSGAAQL